MSKVCHVTSVHSKEDVRIFGKECISLVKVGQAWETVVGQRGVQKDRCQCGLL